VERFPLQAILAIYGLELLPALGSSICHEDHEPVNFGRDIFFCTACLKA